MKISRRYVNFVIFGMLFLSHVNGYSEIFSDNIFTYETLNNNQDAVTITDINNKSINKEKRLTIPHHVSFNNTNYIVTELNDSLFKGTQTLEEISIPSSITKIGANAFAQCANLKSVTIDSIESKFISIGNGAFESCTKLGHILIPSSIQSIGEAAFKNCNALTRIEFTNPNKTDLREIQKNAFSGCTSLGRVLLKRSNLSMIADGAFSGCKNLTCFDIKTDRHLYVGKDAFDKCSRLKEASFISMAQKKNATDLQICESAFSNCSNLKQLYFGVNMLYLKDNSIFNGCTSLSLISLPPNMILKEGSDPLFYCTYLKEIKLLNCGNTVNVDKDFELGIMEGTGEKQNPTEVYKSVSLSIPAAIDIRALPRPWCRFANIKHYGIASSITGNPAQINYTSDNLISNMPTQEVITFGRQKFIKNVIK